MASVVQSLVATGQVIRGVCYASPERFVGEFTALQNIPPERVGLKGEYDHYGLAKRVKKRFCDRLGSHSVRNILVKQRGAAVLISGKVAHQSMVEQLVEIAMEVDGATHVEVRDVQVNDIHHGFSRKALAVQGS
jgi:osmotically-inducible protein OsmY